MSASEQAHLQFQPSQPGHYLIDPGFSIFSNQIPSTVSPQPPAATTPSVQPLIDFSYNPSNFSQIRPPVHALPPGSSLAPVNLLSPVPRPVSGSGLSRSLSSTPDINLKLVSLHPSFSSLMPVRSVSRLSGDCRHHFAATSTSPVNVSISYLVLILPSMESVILLHYSSTLLILYFSRTAHLHTNSPRNRLLCPFLHLTVRSSAKSSPGLMLV